MSAKKHPSKTDTHHRRKDAAPAQGIRFGIAAILLTAAVFIIIPLAGFDALWGLSYPDYISMTGIGIMGVACIAALWFISHPGVFAESSQRLPGIPYWVAAIALTAAVSVAAYTVPVAFAFLGDGAMYLGEVYRLVMQPGYESSLIKATSYLGGLSIVGIAKVFSFESALTPYVVAGIFFAAVMLLGTFYFLRKEPWQNAALYIALLLGTGGLLLFFGYVELYAAGFCLAGLYLVSAWSAFRNPSSVILPGILLALSIAATASNVILIPSYLLLLHWKYKGEGGKPSLQQSALILLLLTILLVPALYIVFGAAEGNPYLIPLMPFTIMEGSKDMGLHSYTLFSGQHLLDIVNVLFLNGGVAVILLPLLLFFVWKRQKDVLQSPTTLFTWLLVVPALLLVVAGNTTFGMARDWDIMTVPGLILLFTVFVLLVQLRERRVLSAARLIPALFILSAGHAGYWVAMNSDGNASAQRFQDMVVQYEDQVGPAYTYNALENLRKYHFGEGHISLYVQTLERMANLHYDGLTSFRELIGALKNSGTPEQKSAAFSWTFDLLYTIMEDDRPQNRYDYLSDVELRQFVTHGLITAYHQGLASVSDSYVREFRAIFPQWPELLLYDAYHIPKEKPEERYALIQNMDFERLEDVALIIHAGNICAGSKQYPPAAMLYERALSLDAHQYQGVYLNLASVYYRGFHDVNKTIDILTRCTQNCSGTQQAEQAEKILATLRQGTMK